MPSVALQERSAGLSYGMPRRAFPTVVSDDPARFLRTSGPPAESAAATALSAATLRAATVAEKVASGLEPKMSIAPAPIVRLVSAASADELATTSVPAVTV